MRRLLAFALLLSVAIATIGCAEGEVAKDKIMKKLRDALGELDVKRKEIEFKQRELRTQLGDLRERRISAQVRLERLKEKKKAAEAKIESLRGTLAKVNSLVEQAKDAGGTLEKDGVTYTAEDISKTAERQINNFKMANTKLQGLKSSVDALQGSYDYLVQQETKAKDLMEKLEIKISEIDAKKIAVDAVREATTISGDETSINDSIAALEKDIEEMAIDVETALRVEQDKLNELDTNTKNADALLTESPNLDSIGDSLKEILEGGK